MNALLHAVVLATEATEGAAETTANPLGSLLPFLIIGVLFYMLIIRPQRKRQSEQQAMLRRVSPGDEIVTIGGFHGTVQSMTDDTIEVELAPGLVVTMARNSISKTLTEPAPITFDDDEDDLDEFDDEFDDDSDFGDDFDINDLTDGGTDK